MYRLASPRVLLRMRNSCATDAMAAFVGPRCGRSLTTFLSALSLTEFFVWGEVLNCSTSNSISWRRWDIPSACCMDRE